MRSKGREPEYNRTHSKLDALQVSVIRSLKPNRIGLELARYFKVHKQTISKINKRRSWKTIK